ncbi:MAG: hypothetical protein QM703_15410 [Gemmatales bacterium]
MKLRLLALTLIACMTSTLASQDTAMAATVKGNVQKMMDATCSGDYKTVLDMTYPKVLEMMGGKEAALKEIEGAMKSIKAQGITFGVKGVETPTVAKGGKDYYSVTPYSLVMSVPNKKITLISAVIGISSDEGKTWKFINLDDKGEKGVRDMLPNLPADMKIPKQEQKGE